MSRLTFGNCVLDTARRELRREGALVPLEPKSYQVLLYLVERCDRVVSREELLSHAWPDVYVVDSTVARCLTLIRKAVGDSGSAQRVIKTLHGHGYRFVASVVVAGDLPTISAAAAGTGEAVRPPTDAALSPVAVPESRSAGEFRHVSVLGAALSPAFALLAGVDVETQQTLIEQLDAMLRRAVGTYEGHVLQLASDRLSIVFGVPRAQEDHAERALLAALALRQEWETLETAWAAKIGVSITLGIGLHTGAVIVRSASEATAATAAPSLAGDVLPLAEHLARHASGVILVSAEMVPLVGAVAQVVEQTSVAVAERSEPIVAYRVSGPVAPSAIGMAIGMRHHGPFIGRQDDLATLLAHFEHVCAGHGRSVGIVGPPGMGKTRLVSELVRSLGPGACSVVVGRCQSHGQQTSCLPLIDIVHRTFGIDAADTGATATSKARAALQAAKLPPEAIDPIGAHLLRLLDAPRDESPAETASPQELRMQTFAALHSLFLHESECRPLVIVIEDLHWTDATSEDYLTALAGRLAARRLLLLVTFRPGYRPPWQALSIYSQLAVAPLVDEQSLALLRATRRGAPLHAALETQIVTRAQGNPFFVEALTRAVDEQAAPTSPPVVPETIHSILAARIDRLSGPAKHLLQAAAIIGPDVPLRLLRGLASLPDEVFEDGLQALQGTELLYEARVVPEPVYAFQHNLVQEVAYQSLLRRTRHELHRRVVTLLEAQVARSGHGVSQVVDGLDRLAHHALQGELWELAVRYGQQAGMRAFARGSNSEAAAALEQAIAASERLPQERGTVERAIDLRLALRSALLPSGDFAGTLECVREAERLAESLGDHQRLAQTAFFLSLHLYLKGQHAEAVQAGQRAQALTAGRDPIVHALARYLTGIPLQALGRHAEAVECFEQSLAALDGPRRQQFFNLAILPSVTSCAFLASCYAEIGRFADAAARGAEGLEIAERKGHPPSVMFAAWGAGWAAFRQGDTAHALALLERALGICREVGLVLHFPMVAVPLASTYVLAGRTDAAVALLTQTLDRVVAHDMVNFQGVCRFSLAQALLECGRVDEAAQCATQALAIVRRQHERGYEAYTLRILGDIACRRGDTGAALDCQRESLAIADALGMAPLQAHCHAAMGAAHAQQGRLPQARAAFLQAIERYRSLAMGSCEQGVDALLKRLR